ncbi:hypothetical protein MP228_005412 [Amoeboaphelidium protococcarum]|nr:hypothetical protein MP228_005412 [Amoeboaphelidium protococcarum]
MTMIRRTVLALPVKDKAINFFGANSPVALNVGSQKQSESGGNVKVPFSLKFRMLVDKYADKAHTKWHQYGSMDNKESWKFKLYSYGSALMNKVDADEWFLKEISPVASVDDQVNDYGFKFLYPSLIDKKIVKSRLQNMLDYRIPYHQKYRRLSVYCIPLSMLGGILPGPNVFLMYNLFRLYSHDKAYRGACHLKERIDGDSFQSDQNLDLLLGQRLKSFKGGHWMEYEPSASLLNQLRRDYDMPPGTFQTHVQRAITQVLSKQCGDGDQTLEKQAKQNEH